METENLKHKIKEQDLKIKKLEQSKKRLKRKIEKLEKELYIENNKRANNKKTRLRVKDIIDIYPVGKSTTWLYAKRGDITPIKNSSRVTTFDAKEVKEFFKSINKEARDITPNFDAKVAKERKVKKENAPQSPLNIKSTKNS